MPAEKLNAPGAPKAGAAETVAPSDATITSSPVPLLKTRYGLAAFWFASLLLAWTVLRVVLLLAFKPKWGSASELFLTVVNGFQRDACAALVETLPLLAWMLIVPNRWFAARWHRVAFSGALFVGFFAQIFLVFVEFFFFDEFKSRFNTVAVDYLLYPYEVATNIWESYPVTLIVGVCLALSAGWLFAALKLFPHLWRQPFRARKRFALLAGTAVIAFALAMTFNLKRVTVSHDRAVNEVANNGAVSFLAAAWTHHLDYAAFYRTMPLSDAYARVRRMLAEPNATFTAEGESIRRRIAGDPSRPKLNVVILLEESLGSEFWGCLGRKETLTPRMDKFALEESLLFTNIYACGNRTVRGMEGVLSSFPPLPGDAIVKRDLSDNVETLARVLKRDGYSTLFLYGGRGVFDSMRSYAVRNGYDRFIEQKHFKNPTFTTAWGVCNEDLFDRSLQEFRALSDAGQPFFGTVLTVSNHRPYTYPKGRIPEDPDKQWRRNAVKYADYSLGRFFDAARQERFWTNTLFVVIADHGARVYGDQTIPVHSYEIPLLIAGPAVVKSPRRIPALGSSLDVSPTVLGLLGRPYDTLFLGRDLLNSDPERGRAFLQHNRDIGMLARDRMVVLGLMDSVEFYAGDPKKTEMRLMTEPGAAEAELERDTVAMYQVADHLYTHRLYRIDPDGLAPGSGVQAGSRRLKRSRVSAILSSERSSPLPGSRSWATLSWSAIRVVAGPE